MEEATISGLVLTSNENVFYTTGLPVTRGARNPILFALWNKFPSFSVIRSDGSPLMIAWTGALTGHDFWVKDVRSSYMSGGTTDLLLSAVAEAFQPGSRIGIESSTPFAITSAIARRVRDVQFVIVDDLLDSLRLVKSAEEVRLLKGALEIAEGTVERVQGRMTERATVFGLTTDASRTVYELGATGVDHMTIAIGTSNPEILEDAVAKPGDLVVLDVGALLEGYASDNRRLSHIGDIPSGMRELNESMVSIVLQTGRSVRPGMKFGEVCVEAERLYKEKGLAPMFLNAGHTIGIQTEEAWVSRGSEREFAEGVVFNIELYSMFKPHLFIGTEDTFVVTSSGVETLSRLPHEIAEVVVTQTG